MAFCIPCGGAVDVNIRVDERPELQTDHSATTIRTAKGARHYTRTTYRTKWTKHEVAVCTVCGNDVEFPDADTADEALGQQDLRTGEALFTAFMWLMWPTLAAGAAFYLWREQVSLDPPWLTFGLWIVALLIVPPLVGYGAFRAAVALLPIALLDVAAVGMRIVCFSAIGIALCAGIAWVLGSGPNNPSAGVEAATGAASLVGAGCLVWLLVRVVHVVRVRRRLTSLVGSPGGPTAPQKGRRFQVPGADG